MTISYMCDLGSGQQIVIESEGSQTMVTQTHSGSGQQQSQRSGFATGTWEMPPTLFRTPTGVVLRIEGAQGQYFIGLQGAQLGRLHVIPSLTGAEVLPLRQVEGAHAPPSMEPMKPMQPMEPMEPMESMEPMKPMKPMQMQMGGMQMQMHMGTDESTQPERRFCGQCGHSTTETDRFCTRCGHRLT